MKVDEYGAGLCLKLMLQNFGKKMKYKEELEELAGELTQRSR
jgi:hypothetical protein